MTHEFVRVYEGAFPADLCAQLRDFCDVWATAQDSRVRHIDTAARKCVTVEMTLDAALMARTVQAVRALFQQYKKDINDGGHLNHVSGVEIPNVVRYEPGGFFHEHCDTWNYESALRQVSVIVYLNTVVQGGEIVFGGRQPTTVRPREGRTVVFPSVFTHPHTAKPAVSGPKYALVVWLTLPNKPNTQHYGLLA